MANQSEPTLSKWIFFAGDAVLLALAWFIQWQGHRPLNAAETGFIVLCCAVGAAFAAAPFVLEYRAALRSSETAELASATAQLQNLEALAAQVAAATAQWQTVQELSAKTAATARDIAGRVTAEAAAFGEFLQKANDGEKATLRLEAEKLRRAEGEWLQVVVRMLDHTFALHQAAVRSGQPGLIDQLGQFQNACRDAARRTGLVPLVPVNGEPFNPKLHQVLEGQAPPPPGAPITEIVATGFSFQGQLVRPALVKVSTGELSAGPRSESAASLEDEPAEADDDETSEPPVTEPLL